MNNEKTETILIFCIFILGLVLGLMIGYTVMTTNIEKYKNNYYTTYEEQTYKLVPVTKQYKIINEEK